MRVFAVDGWDEDRQPDLQMARWPQTQRWVSVAAVKSHRWFRFLVFGVGLAISVATPGRSQLVHLAFSESESWINFKADSVTIPWDLSGGTIERLDVYYDLSSAVNLGDGAYAFSDPTRNVWRVVVQHAGELGTFEIIRPLTKLTVWEDSLMFEHMIDNGVAWEVAEFTLAFSGAGAQPYMLPVPPVNLGQGLGQNHFFVHGTRSFFDAPNLAEAYGGAHFDRATARFADRVDFSPVPEPATYALGGAALAIASILLSRRRGRESHRCNWCHESVFEPLRNR